MKKKYDYDAYRAKFAKRNKSYCFNLDKTEDAKLIEWLDAAHNKSKTIRVALRYFMEANKNE